MKFQKNHEACNGNKDNGIEIGLLCDTPNQGKSGTYWLDTVENEKSPCYFTTMEIAKDALDAMESGWNDLWSIDVTQVVGK